MLRHPLHDPRLPQLGPRVGERADRRGRVADEIPRGGDLGRGGGGDEVAAVVEDDVGGDGGVDPDDVLELFVAELVGRLRLCVLLR